MSGKAYVTTERELCLAPDGIGRFRICRCEECSWMKEDCIGNVCMNPASERYKQDAGWPHCYGCEDWESAEENGPGPEDEKEGQAEPGGAKDGQDGTAGEGPVPEDARETEAGRLALIPEAAVQLHADVQQISGILLQMGAMMATMQKRMDEMEARQAAVTVLHGDVKRIQARIRNRADEICRKYSLEDPESARIFRAAIKKDVLRRWQVKDLHDLPASAAGGAESLIDGWTNIRLVMERRGNA